jgi:hypothetical protein
MTDPFSSDRNSTNGAKAPHPPRAEESDLLAAKLPQLPPTPTAYETLSPGVRRDVRRAFLILLCSGLLIGVLTATGVVWVMHQFDLIGVPEQPAP